MFIDKSFYTSKRYTLLQVESIRLNHQESLSHIDNRDMTDPNKILNEIGIKPIKVWDHLDDHNVCAEISKEVKSKSGIYLIGNKITNNTYVGSASTNKIYTRFRNHLYNNNGNKLIKKSLDKYGIQNFFYVILEYFPNIVTKENIKELLLLEIKYIKEIGPKYNILTEAGNSFGYKHNEEILLKIKDNYPEKNRGPDYKTSESCKKINNLHSKNVNIIDINTNKILCIFNSNNKTAHYLNCSVKTIQHALALGVISLPDLFIPFLNQSHIDYHNSISEYIDTSKLYLYKYKKSNSYKSIKLRGSTITYKHFTQFKITHSINI